MYNSTLSSSIRLCGQTVSVGKLVFQKNLFRSIVITVGEDWKRFQVFWANDEHARMATIMHKYHSSLELKECPCKL